MRLELTRVGLLVELANHYTTRGAYITQIWKRMLPTEIECFKTFSYFLFHLITFMSR